MISGANGFLRKPSDGAFFGAKRDRLYHCLWFVSAVAALLITFPLSASPLTCNSTRSMAYPCPNDSVGNASTDDGIDDLLNSQPHFSAYIKEQAFGHCSWVGGIVYRCPEIVGGDNGQTIIKPPGNGGSDPGGPYPEPVPIPEPQMALPIALAALCGLALRTINTGANVWRGSL
jgi:hypothetical protein